MEHIINMSPMGSASFVEWTTKFLRQRLALATVHHPHGLLQINFVSHQDDGNILWSSDFVDKISVLHCLIKAVSENCK